jgi:nicotinamidase-related amidase
VVRDGKIWHELAPAEDEIVIHKPSYGAFYDTPLQTILTNLGRDTILICGTLANFCCGTTARQSYERGFNVVVVGDLAATDDRELDEAELKTLRKGFARAHARRAARRVPAEGQFPLTEEWRRFHSPARRG